MRIGFVSDAHGNLEGFHRALALLRREGAEEVYCLGDSVGYLHGLQVVGALQAEGVSSLAGNHEIMLLRGNVEEAREEVYRLGPTRSELSPETHRLIAGWPSARSLRRAEVDIFLYHGSPADPQNGYLYPDSDLSPYEGHRSGLIVTGHTHRPFIRTAGDKLFINVGSCGLPRDDGRYGCACLFDVEKRDAVLLRFDIEAELRKAIRTYGPVHRTVERLLQRRSDKLVGKLVT